MWSTRAAIVRDNIPAIHPNTQLIFSLGVAQTDTMCKSQQRSILISNLKIEVLILGMKVSGGRSGTRPKSGDDFREFSSLARCEKFWRFFMNIYMVTFLALILAWFLGWIVFGVSSVWIHILLGAAVVSFILYFFRGRHAEADLRIKS